MLYTNAICLNNERCNKIRMLLRWFSYIPRIINNNNNNNNNIIIIIIGNVTLYMYI